jgi:sugar-specific transcriptional regulator TrmB
MSEQTLVEETVDTQRLESLIEDLSKSLNKDDEAIEIISKGADAIVEQNKALVEAVQKSIEGINEKLDTFVARLESLEGNLEKGLGEIANQPIKKAITAEAEVAPAEVKEEEKVVISKSMVINACLAELQNEINPSRLADLRKGIARLESNYDPQVVAKSLNINI